MKLRGGRRVGGAFGNVVVGVVVGWWCRLVRNLKRKRKGKEGMELVGVGVRT